MDDYTSIVNRYGYSSNGNQGVHKDKNRLKGKSF